MNAAVGRVGSRQPQVGNAPRILMATTVGISVRGGLLPLARHCHERGWHVEAMANGITDFPECREAFSHVWEASWSRSPLDVRNLSSAAAEVRRVVAERRPDIVHVHTPVAAFALRYALRNYGPASPRVIYTAHGFHFHPGGSAFRNLAFRSLEKLAARWTDYLVVINRTDELACTDYGITPRKGVRYIPGIGIDTQRFSKSNISAADVERVRRELNVDSGTRMLLMVAEFNPGKRHADALHAFSQLRRSDTVLAFAGSGRLLERMKVLAGRLGIAPRVRFLGFRRDVPVLMRASAAVLLPSEREGLPVCLMEAMSLEVPVITTSIRGAADLVADGCGLLCAVGDRRALADAMNQVAENPVDAAARAVRARRRIADFDVRRVNAMYEQLYVEALRDEYVP